MAAVWVLIYRDQADSARRMDCCWQIGRIACEEFLAFPERLPIYGVPNGCGDWNCHATDGDIIAAMEGETCEICLWFRPLPDC